MNNLSFIKLIKGYNNKILMNFIKNEYVSVLNKKDYKQSDLTKIIFHSKYKTNFKYKKLSWKTPSTITNSIISISKDSLIYFDKILICLEKFICKHIVIILEDKLLLKDLYLISRTLNKYNINSCLLITKYNNEYYTDIFGEFIFSIKSNIKCIILNSPFNKNFEDTIFFYKYNPTNNLIKQKSEFKCNSNLFIESQFFNNYLNRKIYFTSIGEIKNAPECDEIFGNIKDINNPEELKQIITTPEFQKYWNVHKDIQDVCKDCEFRYMCVDNKIPYQRSENEWYHKLECNYNPYIAKWQGEDGYKTLAECGVISNENGFSIDHDKIAEINKELWGE